MQPLKERRKNKYFGYVSVQSSKFKVLFSARLLCYPGIKRALSFREKFELTEYVCSRSALFIIECKIG